MVRVEPNGAAWSGSPSTRWFIKIHGKTHYLWRAVDQDGAVLDIPVTSRRKAKAATRFFRKLLGGLRYMPRCWSPTSWPATAWPTDS
jgi:DDE domain